MPNHCYNRVTISAHEGKEDQFKKLVEIFESDSPFEALYPSPDWPNTPNDKGELPELKDCLLYTSPSPRDSDTSRMPSSA